MKYHVPTGFGFSPKAIGVYPFGDATDLAGEGGVGDMVWLIQASAWNQTCHSTNDRCEALVSPKGCFLCFCFSPPVFIHRTEGRSWYQPILHNHNLPSPRLNPTPYPYHQATLNRSAIFACMVFRIMRHLRWLWLQISFLVGFYIYFAQIGAFSRKIIIFAKARLSISLKY